MKMLINGEPITLVVKSPNGADVFGKQIYSTEEVTIDNVLVGSPSSEDAITEINVSGKHILYTLAIPSDDTHDWENTEVIVRGMRCRTIGLPIAYNPDNMPTWFPWNKQIKVEAYNG